MAISSYASLKDTALDWLDDQAIPANIVDTSVQLAENRIYRGSTIRSGNDPSQTIQIAPLRIRAMESNFQTAISTLSVPADYVEMKAMTLVNGTDFVNLKRTSLTKLYHMYPQRGATGLPRYVARLRNTFEFGPKEDSDYVAALEYYARLPDLSGTSTNWFTDNAPDVLLYALMLELNLYVRDDEAAIMWGQRLAEGVQQLQKADDDEGVSGSRVITVPS